MESELRNKESFNITLLLNKNQKFEATLSFSNIESEMLSISFKLDNVAL